MVLFTSSVKPISSSFSCVIVELACCKCPAHHWHSGNANQCPHLHLVAPWWRLPPAWLFPMEQQCLLVAEWGTTDLPGAKALLLTQLHPTGWKSPSSHTIGADSNSDPPSTQLSREPKPHSHQRVTGSRVPGLEDPLTQWVLTVGLGRKHNVE